MSDKELKTLLAAAEYLATSQGSDLKFDRVAIGPDTVYFYNEGQLAMIMSLKQYQDLKFKYAVEKGLEDAAAGRTKKLPPDWIE